MDLSFLFFVSSGLFLGWSLGANDAANIFGTAVGSRMLRFSTAALLCSVFVVLGAVVDGAGAARTLGSLGAVNEIAGAFATALAAALAVFLLVRAGMTASTTQAIVGAIVGWNCFTGAYTDADTLLTILATWVFCPVLAALLAMTLSKAVEWSLRRLRPHLLTQDALTRLALILTGAFGAYTLGANNISNVMGVFTTVSPLQDIAVAGWRFSATQQLFLLGALAIAVGVYTYSSRVMQTVGNRLLQVSPVSAWVAVISHSLVLFLFSSRSLERQLIDWELPPIPLVPVSSTQAIVGAMVGIGLLKGGHAVNWRLIGRIGCGWVATPLVAATICVFCLFVLQELLHLSVARQQQFVVSPPVMQRLRAEGLDADTLGILDGRRYDSAQALIASAERREPLEKAERQALLHFSYRSDYQLDADAVDDSWFSTGQRQALSALAGERFEYRWQIRDALASLSEDWRPREDREVPANRLFNRELQQKFDYLYRILER
ncbi:hypothetical protein GCM10011348_30020 [Marinobacterium nitratireducens]|uniref:Phosphate transporter n=1 Tax=Marinobacterium nitratireducens TaxID=518897 RepID=A0A917ZLL5_9GAMM|nr:inorganic phosphate transporter [Marinobacterium nitratireducens]GGO84238.1 hypothetical protein GCM10011348_30020 [Marinobacterium nitratireducens]